MQFPTSNRKAAHRRSAMDKLNIHETADLTRYAVTQSINKSNVQVLYL